MDVLHRAAYRIAYRVLLVWWRLRRPTVHGAYVAVWHAGALLLVRNSYRRGETIPCGRIERRETPRAAARRELLEEAGIEAPEDALERVAEIVLDVDGKRDHAHVFELHLEVRPHVRVDRREVVWGAFVDGWELADRPLVPHVRRYLEERSGEPSDDGPSGGGAASDARS